MADSNTTMTFEEQQKSAFGFLQAFYNRADFGYDVNRWRWSDVNQTIIDIVNQMGNDIATNSKVAAISGFFATLARRGRSWWYIWFFRCIDI